MIRDNSCKQIKLFTKITAFACLASIILSYKLFLSTRNFPHSPVFDFLPTIPSPLDYILLSLIILLLIIIGILRNPQPFVIVFVCIILMLSIFDINRWQPWLYQYFFIFFILSFFNYRCDDTTQQKSILAIFRLMIAAVYFWSGLQKLNPLFLSDTFPWLMEPFGVSKIESFIFLGKSIPIIESVAGILLLINDTKKAAVIVITLMHLFILFIIGPWGHNYNPVVWSWNLAMIAYCFVLYFNEYKFTAEQVRTAFRYNSIKLVFVLFCLMPQLNFFNLWDSYLSHNLYSGNTASGYIIVSDSVKKELPENIAKYAVGDNNYNAINIKNWCMQELGVPAYPEKRNFKKITEIVTKNAINKNEIYLEYTPKKSLLK
jgi:uncharacterized membrane protein YphA (DoxX/SURF4 family)